MNEDTKINFAEFIEEKKAHGWTEALRVYAKVKSPVDDIRLRSEWERTFNQMVNQPIRN